MINKACESHKTYIFLFNAYEKSNKIIDEMLAKKFMDGEEIKMYIVYILFTNHKINNNVNTVDCGEVRDTRRSEMVDAR